MSQLRNVFSGLAQSWTKPTTVPNPPLISSTDLIRSTRSSGVPIVAAAPSPKAVFSTASSGSLKAVAPGRCKVPTMYSLWWRMRPWRASSIAFSRVSAMCQESSTRQSLRLTVWPCFLAALSAKPHCVGSALSPSSDNEPIEMTPQPCWAAGGVLHREPVALRGDPLAVEEAADDLDRLVRAVALGHRVDTERVRVGGDR